MNKQNAKDFLPLVQALAEGKTIQFRLDCEDWRDISSNNIGFVYQRDQYRIKPEKPTLRPWKPEEVPVGALIRHKEQPNCQSLILTKTNSNGIVFYPMTDDRTATDIAFKSLDCLAEFEHSLDHGKTWQPCGVME